MSDETRDKSCKWGGEKTRGARNGETLEQSYSEILSGRAVGQVCNAGFDVLVGGII